jgi:hypothetical protein
LKTTTNYGFKQPEGTDVINIGDISDNFGSIDTEIKKVNNKIITQNVSGSDLNLLITTGKYFGGSMINSPDGTGVYFIDIFNSGSSDILQVVTDIFQNIQYYRIKYKDNWQVWQDFGNGHTHSQYITENSQAFLKKIYKASTINGAGIMPIRHYRDLASYDYNLGGGITGTLKITLPKSWSSTMISLKIKGYNHSSSSAWELNLGGYSYSTNNTWQQISAVLIGKSPFDTVRFGHDGSKCCILLGTTSTFWSYPKIMITELLTAFQTTDNWENGWDISVITSEVGIIGLQTANLNSVQTVSLTKADGTALSMPSSDLSNVTSPGFYYLSGTYTNGPTSSLYGTLHVVYRDSAMCTQIIYRDNGEVNIRTKVSSTWSSWRELYTSTSKIQRYELTNSDGKALELPSGMNSNFNDVKISGCFHINGSYNGTPSGDGQLMSGTLKVVQSSTNSFHQTFTSITGGIWTRSFDGSVWSNWNYQYGNQSNIQRHEITDPNGYTKNAILDFNTGKVSGVYTISSTSSINGAPYTGAIYGTLFVQNREGSSVVQIFISIGNISGIYIRHFLNGSTWTNWQKISTDSDFISSMNSNGYQKLPNGLIIQWGTASESALAYKWVSFPVTFPNSCVNVQLTQFKLNSTYINLQIAELTKDHFIAWNNTYPVQFHWLAIGY